MCIMALTRTDCVRSLRSTAAHSQPKNASTARLQAVVRGVKARTTMQPILQLCISEALLYAKCTKHALELTITIGTDSIVNLKKRGRERNTKIANKS